MSLEPRVDRGVPELTARVVRASFPKGTLAVRVREALGPLFEDESFAGAFPGRGRPAVSPGALALVSVLQYAEGLTDRQAADQVRARMDWKFLLGLELDDPGFDFSVLCDFRARLIEHGLEEKVLDLVLERISELGLLRAGGRQRTDSTHVFAAVRTLNRMEFVGETLRAALEALSAAAPQWLSALITADWAKRYGARIDSYRFPKGDNVRQEWAEQVGRDGFTILEAAFAPGSPGWLREIPAVQVLRRAWVEQYHRDGEGVHWREGKDLPPGRRRLSSPYDPDARYSVKRGSGWCGYKTHLSETCEPDAPHLITHVVTTDATVADTEVTERVHQGLAARKLLPGEHDVDAGYVTAAHIVAAQDWYGIELLGPVGLDTHHEHHQGEHFAQSAFAIDWQARTVTCPQGKTSASWSNQRKSSGTPLARVHFTAQDCVSCPVREKCTKAANGKWGRSLTLLPQDQQEALETRRREQLTDQWQQRYNIRAGVEGTISQAVRRTQIRRTRYTGLPKTHLGHIFAATAINIIRLDAWLTGTPLGPTRTSHLARLDLAA
ncbi:IS1182 family transposase [Streptomyces sp. NBC_00120]|uniref:IS1182 family transposase n=1 Tax=unclassified Streptomyces TaxID=2593676 RepID=UPI002255CBF3|nr:IS1182 family transposase [Streptomyces sp. NBC_00120]MCX5321302.1 IS1182 family transposase [Streptomyces sp. NBC_00120]MCX5322077.1 IS1182 family transposase [Streptomyces sp. NBC_00120]MCX5322725.1 IS1182 family transposase [Streptomyces sp. NBC_00120]MCX5323648.1 IS1182 family transposase [Streptomyces sp. NBC_00120]